MSVEAVSWALYDAPMLLTPKGKPDTTARFVLVVFAEHADKNGRNTFPGPARVKFATGLDVRTVERVVRRLEDGKLLERDGFTAGGAVRWRVNMDLQRPLSDWEAIEAAAAAERVAVAERVRTHRALRNQESPVTDAGSVTQPVHNPAVTDPASVTSGHVTDSECVRNGFEVRYVTDAAPGEPPVEPPGTTSGGHAAPRTPLRTDSPQAARRTDQPTAPDRSKTTPTQLDPESPVPRVTGVASAPEPRRAGRTTWKQQRAATANLDPELRAAAREELEAQRRRAQIHAVPNPAPDESTGAAS